MRTYSIVSRGTEHGSQRLAAYSLATCARCLMILITRRSRRWRWPTADAADYVATIPRDGGGWQRDSAGRFRARRVVVKARVVKLARKGSGARGPKMRGGASTGAIDAHLRYLERDGVTRDGEKGHAYSAIENEADSKAFIERGRDDSHQFRFIVAPEDAAEMGDLRGFTRDLMRKMEADLGTDLDWIAVDLHNTGHPHTHVIVRGVLDDGRILNIAGDYIAHGVRHRAQELVTLELGPQISANTSSTSAPRPRS